MLNENEKNLKEELEQFKEEKQRIREVMGSHGSKSSAKKDKIINYLIAGIVVILLGVSSLSMLGYDLIFPTTFYIEIGIAIVSFKIIWMMHRNAQVYHFQFWILHSIEFRLTKLSNDINEMEEKIDKLDNKNKKTETKN